MWFWLFEFLEDIAQIDLLADDSVKILDLDSLLLHCVAMTDGHATICERIVVNCNAERCSDCILTAISLADGVLST